MTQSRRRPPRRPPRLLPLASLLLLVLLALPTASLSIRSSAAVQPADNEFLRLLERRPPALQERNLEAAEERVEERAPGLKMTFSDYMRMKHHARREEKRLEKEKKRLARRMEVMGKVVEGRLPGQVLTQNVSGDEVPDSRIGGVGSLQDSEDELYSVIPEVDPTHLALTLVSVFIVLFGLFSAFIKEKLFAGEAIIAVVMGIAFGPYGANLLDPREWGDGNSFDDLTLEFTRVVIALSVFAVGVELPRAYIWRHRLSLSLLLGPVMLVGWLVVGAFMYILIPKVDFLQSLVIAAAATPTDPILAASVVGKGKYAQEHVPGHLRHMLQCESGSNDGAAFPFLYLAMFLLLRGTHSIGRAIGQWIVLVILYQIILGVVIGGVIGVLARKLLKFCKRKSTIDRESMVAMYVALALLTTGLTTLAGSDDLLAAFACGTAFAWDDWFTESIEESNFSNIIDLLINCTTFIYIGATIPFSAWNDPDLTLQPWRLATLAICIILLRRMPAVLVLGKVLPDVKTPREAVFVGHFGPIGVGAIFISTLAALKLPTPSIPPENTIDVLALTVQPVTYCLVLCSILVHGLSIPFFTLGHRMHHRVTSMTRTWTQASGQEPAWLSRVKRADKSGEIPVPERPSPTEEKEKVDVSPSPSGSSTEAERDPEKIDIGKLEKGEGPAVTFDVGQDGERKQIRIEEPPEAEDVVAPPQPGFPDTSSKQAAIEKMVLGGIAEEQGGGDEEGEGTAEGSAEQGEQTGLTRVPSRPSERKSPRRASFVSAVRPAMFRMPTATKRTADEEIEHQKEKLARDAWCRRERRDNPKKDEERMYVSGRKIIVERGPGDEVEVREVDPSPEAARRAKLDPTLGLIKISGKRMQSETEAIQKESGQVGPGEETNTMTQAYEAAKRLVSRRFTFSGGEGGPSMLPAPGLGPKQGRASLEEDVREITARDYIHAKDEKGKGKRPEGPDDEKGAPPIESPGEKAKEEEEGVIDNSNQVQCHETHYDTHGERQWVEGDKLIIERNDGEDVEVRQLSPKEVQELHEHHVGAELARKFSPQKVGHDLEHALAAEGKKGWSLLRHGRLSPSRSPPKSPPKSPRRSLESHPEKHAAPTAAGATASSMGTEASLDAVREEPQSRAERQAEAKGKTKEEPSMPTHHQHRKLDDARNLPRETGHDDVDWTEEDSPDAADASSSSNGGDSRGRPRRPRLRSRSGSKSSPRRPRAGSGRSIRSNRSPAPPRSPSPAPPLAASATPPQEADGSEPSQGEESPNTEMRPSVARHILEREQNRPARRSGSGLLLPPGEGVAFGTEGHYSRSSSPNRSIRFVEARRPGRDSAPGSEAGSDDGAAGDGTGSGQSTPRKHKRSRLRFGSSKSKGSRLRPGPGGESAQTGGDEEDVIG